ncbi:hypothetical protein V6N11_054907 [Hibiscus sabdariffa]|uniref:Uncharacterized protein n=2 Tax=Hibiscus sabdariffa TaxID=183260 RepID=A0ABR2P3V1_9ROSI
MCLAIEAKLWGIYEGFYFAWELGIAKLYLESDCVNALRVIKDNEWSWSSLSIAIEAELWGIYEGLRFAWELSIAKLCLESDCVNALRFIKDNERS